ncbi:MAG TPA: DUF948 domain-containing protein [Dissulfurispiraceae bacterium]|nr:DUF948 domain-containing protein [Dissulfurispiraceae bacterium]
MADHTWLIIMISTVSCILALGILTAIGLLIYAIFEIRKAVAALNSSLKVTEERLNPVILQTEQLLRSVRRVADDVGAVTYTARSIAEAGSDLVINLKALSSLLNDIGEGLSLKAFGVKAGVKTAINVLINQLKERR